MGKIRTASGKILEFTPHLETAVNKFAKTGKPADKRAIFSLIQYIAADAQLIMNVAGGLEKILNREL